MEVLVSKHCPHPYDGLVAGCYAEEFAFLQSFFNHFEGREQGQDPTRRFWCMIVTAPGDKSTPYEREK